MPLSRFSIGLTALLLTACTALQPQTPVEQTGTVSISQSNSRSSRSRIIGSLASSGTLVTGKSTAPVTLLLFTNHNCAYCKDFEYGIVPRLVSDYIETGKVTMITVPFTIQKYPDSALHARTLLCGVLGGSGTLTNRQLFDGVAKFPSLASCLTDENETLDALLQAQQSLATSLEVTVVPTYFLNGQKFMGLPEYADLRGQIEEAMKNE